jgi:signal transduction histidine kinase
VLAFAVSLAVSLLLVWLLNRFLRRFNLACDRVMAGNITHRIKTYGTDDEFDRLAENVNRMLDWNGALIAMVKDSSNSIAHDMRTPLSRLRLELRALSDRARLDAETRKLVMEQVECVDRLVEMFDNILNIAKAESRSSTELFESVDISRLVQDVLEFYQPVIEKKHLFLCMDIPEAPLVLRGDKQLLSQAMVNLIDNACKFTPKGGRIEVRLEREGNKILLTVADSGIGIPAELLEKVKERFFRMDTSRHTAGHGLGLSIVNAVAVLHQGALALEDNFPGLKATLTLQGAINAPVLVGN